MSRDEYLEFKRDDRREFTPVIHYYYLLNGGVIKDLDMFTNQYTRWVLGQSFGFVDSFKRNLARINQYIILELDKHFSINT